VSSDVQESPNILAYPIEHLPQSTTNQMAYYSSDTPDLVDLTGPYDDSPSSSSTYTTGQGAAPTRPSQLIPSHNLLPNPYSIIHQRVAGRVRKREIKRTRPGHITRPEPPQQAPTLIHFCLWRRPSLERKSWTFEELSEFRYRCYLI
jgi:hypothetical protein